MQQKTANFIGRFFAKNWLLLTFLFIACFVRLFFKYKGQTDLFEFPFSAEVWGTFADWVTASASILTLIAALYALKTWKHQKHYELEIEAKANSWRAYLYILKYTTVSLNSFVLRGDAKERFENIVNESIELASCYLEGFVIEYVRLEHEKTYIELNTLAEKVRFTFGNSKDLNELNIYRFYSLFASSYMTIWTNALDFQQLKVDAFNGNTFDEQKLLALNEFFYYGGLKDIAKKLADAQSLLR